MVKGLSKQSIATKIAYDRGYRVTDDGRFVGSRGNERKLTLKKGAKYPVFSVFMDGQYVNVYVHRFAAYCFYGDKLFDEDLEVRHINHDVLDISRENIKLGTSSDNKLDKPKEERVRIAMGAVERKRSLNENQVKEVKALLGDGFRNKDIASKLGISQNTISMIKRGLIYKWV